MIVLILAVIALVAAVVILIRSEGRDLSGWGILALALIPLLGGLGINP